MKCTGGERYLNFLCLHINSFKTVVFAKRKTNQISIEGENAFLRDSDVFTVIDNCVQ